MPPTRYIRFLEQVLTPGRLTYCQGVMQVMQDRARLKQTVYAGRLQEGAVLHTGWLMQMFEAKGFPIHPNIRTTYQEFSRQLNLDDTFLDQRPL